MSSIEEIIKESDQMIKAGKPEDDVIQYVEQAIRLLNAVTMAVI